MAVEKVFLVEGEFIKKGKKQKFSKRVSAGSSKFAVEKVLCLLGSKNKLSRRHILLHEVKEEKAV